MTVETPEILKKARAEFQRIYGRAYDASKDTWRLKAIIKDLINKRPVGTTKPLKPEEKKADSNILGWIVFIVGIMWWNGWGYFAETPAQWDAFYYPDKHDLTEVIPAYNVGSKEACVQFAYQTAERYNDPAIMRGDYECGKNPKKHLSYGMTVYEESVR